MTALLVLIVPIGLIVLVLAGRFAVIVAISAKVDSFGGPGGID
jgi:hypothetical protein